jgi:hypothetical protein
MTHTVCYSGGHSSALVAIEAVRKYGKDGVILLNHDISSHVEHEDIKRFKNEVAEYLGIKITYANAENFEEMTPISIARQMHGFQFQIGITPCTKRLKTMPFYKWLEQNFPSSLSSPSKEITILYGFDADEKERISRRESLLRSMGYRSEFPLAQWPRTIYNTEEIGIKKPSTYGIYKHANCIGCLKAGKQH